MNQSNQHICPKCAAAIPDEAPGGLCPKCALESVATVANTTPGGRKSPPPGIAEIAPHFPELEILELIGAGGMGAVYKARQPQLDRFVALKILSHDLAGDPPFVERFNREARVLARLSHPNIVGIHDFGTAGPYCYLTMEYVDGVNLRQAMRAGRFTPTEALEMVQHLCSALKFAHEEGILHRDIKPENILIDSKGRIKVADFGIAKLVGEDRHHDVTLTIQGSVLGSPHYMAPEQIETPGDVDQRADIYSLGVVLYEMLTGGLPIGRFALPSEKAAMDARIDEIVLRTLAKDRQARFQSAGEVGTQVAAVAAHPQAPGPVAAASVDSKSARFNLTAVILTGLSLVLVALVAIMVGVIHPGVATGPDEQKKLHLMFASIMLFIGLPTAICAVTGFIFGTRALGEIRASGGIKSGLGNSIFAVATWPIIFLFLLAMVPLTITSPDDGPYLGTFAGIFVVSIPALVAAWLLVRSIYRWTVGAERKDGTRFHPGLGIPLLMVMLVIIGGPVLSYEIARMIPPAGESRDPDAAGRQTPKSQRALINEMIAEASSSSQTRWRLGKPEVMIPLIVLPGQRVSVRVLLRDSEGNVRSVDLGESAPALGDPRSIELLQIGTYLKDDRSKGSLQALAAVRSGRNSRQVHSLEDLRGWKFSETLPEMIDFAAPGRREFILATLRKDGTEFSSDTLVLEVIVTGTDPRGSDVQWLRSEPELTLPIPVHPRYRAEFRLVQSDGRRNPQKTVNIGNWMPLSETDRKVRREDDMYECVATIGTVKPQADEAKGRAGVMVQLGEGGVCGTLYSETDFSDWRFSVPGRILPLTGERLYSYRVASREWKENGKNVVAEQLYLEIQLTER